MPFFTFKCLINTLFHNSIHLTHLFFGVVNAVFEMVSPEDLVREVGGPGLRGVAAGLHHALQRHDVLEPGHSGCGAVEGGASRA